ncbi:hypothetical protein DIJ62_16875 [Burkholderia pseudomallei]|nr:hypothetical protein DIJ62_16875 [Burkholderia pseudomallei]
MRSCGRAANRRRVASRRRFDQVPIGHRSTRMIERHPARLQALVNGHRACGARQRNSARRHALRRIRLRRRDGG